MKGSEIKRKIKEEGWLRIHMVQEIAGFPKDHVESTMDIMNGDLVKRPGIEILNRKIHEAKLVDEKNGVWSMFAEIELLVKNFPEILNIVYDFMPSSIEIVEPATIKMDTNLLNNSVNDMIAKMHQLDSSVKKLYARAKFLSDQLKASKEPASENKK
tara:strand:- start:98 stop:568 length:471 start_codon:yes stop_codon:yes gene_type:complete